MKVTPEEYELEVRSWLEKSGPELREFEVTHRETVQGSSGEYEIDAVARFRAFRGAEFVVLVECKRHTRPVEREDLITLLGKVRDVGAHKGMLFATCGFQSGAIRYAEQNGIAAITFTDGRFIYEALSRQPPPVGYRPPGLPRFVGLFLEPGEYGPSSSSILPDHLDPLSEWLGKVDGGA